MNHPTWISIILFLTCLRLSAQDTPHEKLNAALRLEERGQFEAGIDLIKLTIDSKQLSQVELGRAYMMLGFAYRAEAHFAAAQIAFDHSILILEHDQEHVGDYASALANYAGFYRDIGQSRMAETLWLKAVRLREKIGDHKAAIASLIHLAGLEVTQNRVGKAKEYLRRVSEEKKLTREPIDDEELVLFFETQGLLALRERDMLGAVTSFESSLQACLRSRGERDWLTGWERILCGRAYALTGETPRALAEMREGLSILDDAVGRKNPMYLAAQVSYSVVLERDGEHEEAVRMRSTAEQSLKELCPRQCSDYTIDVAHLR
jgi:tetratricopeptide (TPR) repeat protein